VAGAYIGNPCQADRCLDRLARDDLVGLAENIDEIAVRQEVRLCARRRDCDFRAGQGEFLQRQVRIDIFFVGVDINRFAL